MYAAAAKSLQSCPTLCDPIDSSPLGSSVPGILQARILEWVTISFSNKCYGKHILKIHTFWGLADSLIEKKSFALISE
jgi:hypothetical protein